MYGQGSRGFDKLDPHWQKFAASLRKDQIYVKMPVGKARAICIVWPVISAHVHERDIREIWTLDALVKLLTDEASGSQEYGIKSVFYSLTVESCQKDIDALRVFVEKDATGVFRAFMDALEGGLRSDPAFDWITRVGGPSSHPFEALQRDSDPVDILFEDLFDFPDEPNA